MYYQYVSGDDYNILYVGSSEWDGATTSLPSFSNPTRVIGKTDLTSLNHIFSNSSYDYYDKSAIVSVDLSGVKVSGSAASFCYRETKLTSVKLPDTSEITSLANAFYGCTSLTDITFNNLSLCTSLYYTFYGCTALTTVSLPSLPVCKSLVDCFYNCSKLESVSEINAPNNATMEACFCQCSIIKTVNIKPMPLCTAFDYCFYNCSNLVSINMPTMPSCISFGYCFYKCSALTTVSLSAQPCCVDYSYMFYDCDSLENIELPNMSGSVNCEYMFAECSSLSSVSHGIIGGVQESATSMSISLSHMFENCMVLTSFDFEGVMVSNCYYMFSGCSLLNSITNLNSLTITGASHMFYECIMLTTLEAYLPNLYTADYMFYSSGLRTLSGYCLGYNCDYMFANCNKLTTLNMAPREEIQVNNTMFNSCTKLVGGNGTTYNPNTVGSSMCVVDDDSHQGYLTYTKNRDIYTVSYVSPPSGSICTKCAGSGYADAYYKFYDVQGCNRRVADGSSLTLKGVSKGADVMGYLVVGADGTQNLIQGSEVSIPITQKTTIYILVNFGGSGSSTLNAVIKAIANPQ